MASNTQTGLLILIFWSIISLIYSLIVSVAFFFIEDYQTFLIIGVSRFFSFIVGILFLVGAILFLIGRKEFGERHRKNVINALLIFIFNFVLGVVLVSATVYFMVSFGISSLSSSSDINVAPFSIFLLIIFVVSRVFSGLMYYFALIDLEDEKGRTFIYAGIISSICVSIITSVYISGFIGEKFGEISSLNSATSITGFQNIGGIGILSVIPGILFFFALYIPYNRIKIGELAPQILQTYIPTYSTNFPVRYCPSCGRSIPMDAMFCAYCGKRF